MKLTNNFSCQNKILLFTIFLMINFSFNRCSYYDQYPNEVTLTLKQAGNNSTELKKVLELYRLDRKNPLKYKAACFLISNMRDKFSKVLPGKMPAEIISSFSFIDSLTRSTFFSDNKSALFKLADYLNSQLDTNDFSATQDIIDSLISWKYGVTDSVNRLKSEYNEFIRCSDSIRDLLLTRIDTVNAEYGPFYDSDNIKADWLIRHIENAFKMRQVSPFAKGMKFEEFCETLLSYRSFNEPLDLDFPSDSISKWLLPIIKSTKSDIGEVIKKLNLYIYALDCFEDSGKNLGYLGFYDILQFYKYDCDRHAEWVVKILNASGIPAVLDFTSGFFIRDKMHFGVSVRDTAGLYHHFTAKWQQIDDTAHSKLFSKVYRNTFAPQNGCPVKLKSKEETVPQIFSNSHIKDVTDNFHEVLDISIRYKDIPSQLNVGYLAIFSKRGWKPIGWGKINRVKNVIEFEKVPVDAMYIAGSYDDNFFQPTSEPFFLDKRGQISFIKPEYKNIQQLHLVRKYPFKKNLSEFMNKMAGSRIEGSNKTDFSDKKLLHVLNIQDLQDFAVKAISIKGARVYRYIRLVPPKEVMLNIAEISFFSRRRKSKISNNSILPYILSARDTLMLDTSNLIKIPFTFLPNSQNLEKALDRNMETFICVPHLELTFRERETIKQVRIAPRNANNGIVVGNKYRLYFYDKGWIVFDEKIAKYNFLDFEGVPTGTIYWLQNLDGGKEELPFVYKNDKQFFINNNEPDGRF